MLNYIMFNIRPLITEVTKGLIFITYHFDNEIIKANYSILSKGHIITFIITYIIKESH